MPRLCSARWRALAGGSTSSFSTLAATIPSEGAGFRASGGALAQMPTPEGTLISYATQPGNVEDGADGDSPYTKALTATMRTRAYIFFRRSMKSALR